MGKVKRVSALMAVSMCLFLLISIETVFAEDSEVGSSYTPSGSTKTVLLVGTAVNTGIAVPVAYNVTIGASFDASPLRIGLKIVTPRGSCVYQRDKYLPEVCDFTAYIANISETRGNVTNTKYSDELVSIPIIGSPSDSNEAKSWSEGFEAMGSITVKTEAVTQWSPNVITSVFSASHSYSGRIA